MTWVLAVTAAALAGMGTWLALDRTLTRILLGLGLWGHAAVLLLLVAGGRAGDAPIGKADGLDEGAVADPLVQALALTAIVITFAVTAFLLALAARSWMLTGDDLVQDDLEDRRVAAQAGDEDLPRMPPDDFETTVERDGPEEGDGGDRGRDDGGRVS